MEAISPDRPIVRWFLFSVDAASQMIGYNLRQNISTGTNICMLFHMTWIGVLVILLHLALVFGIWYALLQFPISLFGGRGYASMWISVGAVLAIVMGCKKYLKSNMHYNRVSRRKMVKKEKARAKYYDRIDTSLESKGPSLTELLIEWVKAKKDRFCIKVPWSQPISTEPVKRRFILPGSLYFGSAGVIVGITGVFNLLSWTGVTLKANFSTVTRESCTFVSARFYHETTGEVEVDLRCGSIDAWTTANSTAIYFLNNPRSSLTCDVYGDREASCDIPKSQ